MSKAIVVVTVAASLLAGCSHNLAVLPAAAKDGSVGATYVLPFTQYATTITWRVVDCSTGKISVKAETKEEAAPDGTQAYVIDPASLQTLTSIGVFKATWADGGLMLSSINASSEDRTGAIIGNLVNTVAKLAAFPLQAAPGAPAGATNVCSMKVRTAVDEVDLRADEVDAQNLALIQLTSDLQRLTARAAAMGDAVDDATKAGIAAKMDALEAKRAEQEGSAKKLAAALKATTYSQLVRWPEDSTQIRTTAGLQMPPEVVQTWFPGGAATAVRDSSVYMAIERVGSFGKPTTGQPLLDAKQVDGIGVRYRVPGIGRFRTCAKAVCGALGSVVLLEQQGQIAQLGYVNLLPVRNRTFGSTTFAAEFTTAGGLKSLGYEQKSAPAEGASAALAQAAEGLSGAFGPVARLQQQTSYLAALKARSDALAAVEPADATASNTKGLQADTALLQAEIQNVEAQIALAKVRAQLQGP